MKYYVYDEWNEEYKEVNPNLPELFDEDWDDEQLDFFGNPCKVAMYHHINKKGEIVSD